MQVFLDLLHKGYLTPEQLSAAQAWRDNPTRMFLAPSLFRIMHDAVFKELSITSIEARHSLPERSAKAILRLVLQSLYECESIFIRKPDDASDQHRAEIEYLSGTNVDLLTDLMRSFSLSRSEGRLLAILMNAKGHAIDYDTLHARLYADRTGDLPNVETVRVMICKLRQKLVGSQFRIETVWGVGFKLVTSEARGIVLPYDQP